MPYPTLASLPDAVKKLPKLGETRRGSELGRPSKSCRYIWQACRVCGKARWVQFYNGQPCSTRCLDCANHELGHGKRGAGNPSWKGGKSKDKQGYVLMNIQPSDFFYPMASHNTIYEHRLVMAKSMNRCLLPWEIVHHLNGVKDDNRLENLQLLPSRLTHIVDTQIKRYVNKLENRVSQLEVQIIQLEADLILLRVGE